MARSATGSVSICWGRINQILNRQLLVNFYSDFGSSGGAVLDRDGWVIIAAVVIVVMAQHSYTHSISLTIYYTFNIERKRSRNILYTDSYLTISICLKNNIPYYYIFYGWHDTTHVPIYVYQHPCCCLYAICHACMYVSYAMNVCHVP